MLNIIVMLIWMGADSGGGAVVQGFYSMAACEASRPIVESKYKEMVFSVKTRCVELPKWLPSEGAK